MALGYGECSTPFGITDYIGHAILTTAEKCQCAQRLSASRIISVTHLFAKITCSMCSTPFGITDYIGRARRAGPRPPPRVLNAFRHHGLYRPRRRRTDRRSRSVLNAFRHHGLYRALGVPAIGPGAVLCSTPFGITDYIGPPAPHRFRPRSSAQRLSASRIISGVITVDEGYRVGVCSTPFGITDYIGLTLVFLVHRSMHGAQRLSASRIISVVRDFDAVRLASGVLNAFRHHGLYRSSGSDRGGLT